MTRPPATLRTALPLVGRKELEIVFKNLLPALSTSKGQRVDPAVPDAAVEAGPAAFQVQSPAPVPGGSDLEQLERIEHQAAGGAQVAGLVLQELGQLDGGRVGILLRRPAGFEH